MAAVPHVPVLRFGEPYASMDVVEVKDVRTGTVVARVSQANAGMVKRDLRRMAEAAQALRRMTCDQLCAVCERAAQLFAQGTLPLGDGQQSPEDYVQSLSRTSGLPHALVRRNMEKVAHVLSTVRQILRGLSLGVPLEAIDVGQGDLAGIPVSFSPTTDALGCVLPSNSPGVNCLWAPAIALRTPVILKPGREEPWTPFRLAMALQAAGAPKEAVSFYPTGHDGAHAILEACGRSVLFGDDKTTNKYAHDPRVERHGTGRSKVLLGDDVADDWPAHLDVIAACVAENGGRSCINASCVITPRYADALAEALAERLARMTPLPPEHPDSGLSAFANPAVAEAIDGMIDDALTTPGAVDVTSRHRAGPRRVVVDGATYLLPTVVRCEAITHPLANTEFLFPYCSVLQIPQSQVLSQIGPTLSLMALTRDDALVRQLLASPDVQRLNLGPMPTSRVHWDQPHEGNMFEFLYRRRALQRAQMPTAS